MDVHAWIPKEENFVRSWMRTCIPKLHSFMLCLDLRPGSALVGLMTIVLPIIDIVQIGEFLYFPVDELDDADGMMMCPNQWYLKTTPISSYAIFSRWPLVIFHLAFAVVYFTLSLALIASVVWKSRHILFLVVIGSILVYIPSALVYILEIATSFKSVATNPAAWIFYFSPLIWVYFVSVIYGYLVEIEFERLFQKGELYKPDVYTKWGPE